MFSMSLEEIIKKISEKTGLDRETIMLKIQQKQKELSNLVTDAGAAHIIANELGVVLVNGINKDRIQISNLVPNLRNAIVLGRVIYKNKIYTFNKEGKVGKVCSFVIGDETGKLRVVLWNEQTELINRLSEGDIVKIFFGIIKKNKYGNLEMHLNLKSKILINPNENVSFIPQLSFFKSSFYERKDIRDIDKDDKVEIKAMIVNINNFRVFELCSNCNSKVVNGKCSKGCEAPIKKNAVLNVIIDDGTGTISASVFGERIRDLIDVDITKQENEHIFKSLLGKEFIFRGVIKENERMERLELNIYSSQPINAVKEINNILKN